MPSDPRPVSALAIGASLLAGAVAGWSLSQLGADTSAPTVLAAGPAASAPSTPAELLEAPATAPAALESSVRVAVRGEPGEPQDLAAPGSGERREAPQVAAELEAEFQDYLRSGRFEAYLRQQEEDLARFLAFSYLQGDEPLRAMALLERFPRDDADLYGAVGAALMDGGDRTAAAAMFAAAIERDPLESSWVQQLRRIDPSAALAALDAQVASSDFADDQVLAAQRASLLAELGRGDEAKALLSSMMAQGASDDWTLEALIQVDPAWAERELRARLADDAEGRHALQLAELLSESGRGEEGAALLEDLLAREPGNGDALDALLDLAPERALARIAAGELDEVDSWTLDQAGTALAERGRTAEAVDLWMRAVSDGLSDEELVDKLVQHAPERLWEHCRAITADTRDDELLGDVADLYWRQGRRNEAVELWRRARRIDPGDGEWREKLRAVNLGRDPL